jgi:small subunit ribosomal protein S18
VAPSLFPASQLTFLASIAGVKYERVRRGRLPKDQHVCSRATPLTPLFFFPVLILIYISIQFLKPADLLPHEDPFRRKRALLGPGAAESRRNDSFYQLGIDPLDEATNPQLLSYFVTDMGKMKSRAETKLTWRNQRRLTKAVRRAKMMGVMPILNKQKSSYKDTV